MWHERFLGSLIRNALLVMADDGVLLLNLGMKQRLDWTGIDFLDGLSCDDFDIAVGEGGRTHKERLIRATRGEGDGRGTQCEICGRLFVELGSHLERTHGVSVSRYRQENPEEKSERKKRQRVSGLRYRKRVAYRCPDGSIVRKKDAWRRAWGVDDPPTQSVVDAASVDLDPWKGKVEGIDFVECLICGYRGSNINRHLRAKHGIEASDYEGGDQE